MSLAHATAATPWGIDARPVSIEVDARFGLPGMQIVGLADVAVRESRQRVKTAILNSDFELPQRSVVVNLAPANLRKQGNHLDLAIALGVLAAHDLLEGDRLDGRLFCGELGLDGSIRPIRGALAIADLAHREGIREIYLPQENAGEAAALGSVDVRPVRTLLDAVTHLRGERRLPVPLPRGRDTRTEAPDLADVRGQASARRAVEIAAAGGHNLLFVGPPGSGKTMLARRLPGILPALSTDEALLVTKVHSLVADRPSDGLVARRPFRSPHPGISTAGLIGGGNVPRPGEVTLAHAGVLFLDEFPEFQRGALESLRQPLEEGWVDVVRTRYRVRFPARFSLVAAMNPCPCGHLGDPRHQCECPPGAVERYRGRISGPLLDRIDLHLEVPAPTLGELKGEPGESSAAVAARVLAARERQQARAGAGSGGSGGGGGARPDGGGAAIAAACNAALRPEQLEAAAPMTSAARALLDRAYDRLGLSARAMGRIVKVARTIADLEGVERLGTDHVAEAIQYRSLDRRHG